MKEEEGGPWKMRSNLRGEYGGCGMVPLILKRFARQSSNSEKGCKLLFFRIGNRLKPYLAKMLYR